MPLLSDKDRQFLESHLRETLQSPVKLIMFTQTIACQFCRETEQVLGELAELSDKIELQVLNFVTDKDEADKYGIDKIPATAIIGDKDYGVRYFGIPSGYEFTSLVEDVIDVSQGDTDLSDETMAFLDGLDEDIHIQVFVTPTCPYCPAAVRLAHSMAIASDRVRADMVESIEFPQLANKYDVYGVPRSVINEDTYVEGALPEELYVAYLKNAVGQLSDEDLEQKMREALGDGEEPEIQEL